MGRDFYTLKCCQTSINFNMLYKPEEEEQEDESEPDHLREK